MSWIDERLEGIGPPQPLLRRKPETPLIAEQRRLVFFSLRLRHVRQHLARTTFALHSAFFSNSQCSSIKVSKPVEKLQASCQYLVTHFPHRNQATKLLLQKEALMDTSPLKLTEDVPTRWNSSCYMTATQSLPSSHGGVVNGRTEIFFSTCSRRTNSGDMIDELIKVLRPQGVATCVHSAVSSTQQHL